MTRDMYEQLVKAIAEGRKKKSKTYARLIDEGPFVADKALERRTRGHAGVRRPARRSRRGEHDWHRGR